MKRRFNIDLPGISIHAPREGGDRPTTTREIPRTNFNPRPPRGGRHIMREVERNILLFQSTPPARGATTGSILHSTSTKISIHAPREGGDIFYGRSAYFPWYFNPRPPRGGRPPPISRIPIVSRFQSTPPARGATTSANRRRSCWLYFNPRPPRGGRRLAQASRTGQ